ncbi:hypothetical protein L1987_01203 [Smallanthus sonchifolius]|uniref:Uncharacterized protein n=1 Tax=Smallanthus sonchifolius TaxID=185202 RepID=A0ACB9K4L3_9ASTR|nr:hypothetical protein L1987_01203 [Smallanthus sonchifolius]
MGSWESRSNREVQYGKLKNPTMKDVVIAEFRNQFDIADKPPTSKNLFDHLKERYKRTNPGKKQIPAISFFENDIINKLSADDKEKEKERESAKVKLRAQVLLETQTQGQDKLEEFNQTDDYWQRRSYYESTAGLIEWLSANASKPAHPATESHYGDKYNKELNEDKAAQAEKGENEKKRTQSQKMMVSLFDTTQFRFGDSMLEDVITEVKKHHNEVVTNETAQGEGGEDGEKKEEKGNEKKPAQEEKTENPKRYPESCRPGDSKPKQMENPRSFKNSGSRFDFAPAVQGAKAGKTSSSKPYVPASTCSVLPGLQTARKDEKPAKGKGREGNEEKPAQVKKLKEVNVGEGKVNEKKVVEDDLKVNEDDNGKTTQDGEVKKEKQHKVNVKKVKEVDAGEGEVDAGEGTVDEQKVVAEDDAGKIAQAGGFETSAPKSKDDSELPVFIGVNLNKKNKEQKKNAARATRPAEVFCSPYVQRVVQLNTKRENIEDRIAEWIFASIEDPWIFVFQNATGTTIPRICMESFHPNEYLHVNAITYWSLVLNSEEIYRSRGARVRCFYTS